MSEQRFRYLLDRYKSDSLSVAELEEWRELIRMESYRTIVEEDIEASLAEPVGDQRWTSEMGREAWENILKSREDAKAGLTKIPKVHFARRIRLVVLVAAACILLALGIWWIIHPSTGGPSIYRMAATQHGMQDRIVLSDGTKVWLNAASSLRYPEGFDGASREIELQGEAYFEVSPDSRRPFKIKAGQLLVEVLGTRLDIEAYTDQPQLRTALLEGSIRITNGDEHIVLDPGQAAVLQQGKGGLQLFRIKEDQVLAWKNHVFAFDSTSLQEVMDQLSRWYDVTIEKKGLAADTLRITGYISRNSTIMEVLEMLHYTAGVRYSIQGRKVMLSAKN